MVKEEKELLEEYEKEYQLGDEFYNT